MLELPNQMKQQVQQQDLLIQKFRFEIATHIYTERLLEPGDHTTDEIRSFANEAAQKSHVYALYFAEAFGLGKVTATPNRVAGKEEPNAERSS